MTDAQSAAWDEAELDGYVNSIIDAQIEFFVSPTKENLETIFDYCNQLREGPMGFFGKYGYIHDAAEKVSEYYEKRFKEQKKITVTSEDICVFLENTSDGIEDKIDYLSELAVRAQGMTIRKDRDGFITQIEKYSYLMKYFLLKRKNFAGKKFFENITTTHIERLLETVGAKNKLLPEYEEKKYIKK